MRAERMIVPRDGPVDLVSAEWSVCVEVADADELYNHNTSVIINQKVKKPTLRNTMHR